MLSENPNGAMRGSRGANFPRVIAPLHRSNSATLKETATAAALAESVSSGYDRVQKSICHLLRQGPDHSPPRGDGSFLRKGRDPRCDEFYVSLRKRVLIDDFFFHRRIDENRETIGCTIDELSRCFSVSGKLARSLKTK